MNDTASSAMFGNTGSHLPRKVFHIVAASIIPAVYYFEILPRAWTFAGVLAVTAVWVGADLARVKLGLFSSLFERFFGILMKAKETRELTGSSFLLIGASLTLAVYTATIASASLLFNAIGDPIAALIGTKLGSKRFSNGKSLEGAAAMFIVCVAIGALTLGLGPVALAGAFAAAITELASPDWIDDNLSVPLVSGGVMTAMEIAL